MNIQPKEKAQDLWLTYYELLPDGIYSNEAAKIEAKKFATIAVNEVLEATKEAVLPMGGATGYDYDSYWLDVKSEIEKL
jgi:hypothetical protein